MDKDKIIIENAHTNNLKNIDIIRYADWIIELGEVQLPHGTINPIIACFNNNKKYCIILQ